MLNLLWRQALRGNRARPLLKSLLNESTDVWCPVEAVRIGRDRYRVTAAKPQDEQWAFGTGPIVRGESETFADGSSGLVAVKP